MPKGFPLSHDKLGGVVGAYGMARALARVRMSVRVAMGFWLWASLVVVTHVEAQNNLTATIRVDASQPGDTIDGYLWGTNLTNESRTSDRTVHNPEFVAAAAQMGVRLIRWPGGNNADSYDWKRHEKIKPGRRVPWDGAISLPEIAAFCRDIGAELSITINFGTGTPEDAADLVEYLNGPADSEWGSLRASQGFPEPLNVRFFEIGNEINQPHQWFNSWTAENPYKYFFGGDEERRGDYQASENVDPIGKKGDAFRADGGSDQTYILRFPPVRNVRVLWAANQEDARNNLFEEWQQVSDLQAYGPNDKVFLLDSLSGNAHLRRRYARRRTATGISGFWWNTPPTAIKALWILPAPCARRPPACPLPLARLPAHSSVRVPLHPRTAYE
ncbi:MAG: hypothetical protein Q9P14_02845 [candidate division KSB1 bacterium]|nr:hypothetical protein [candidate division KSB1 bacterium]